MILPSDSLKAGLDIGKLIKKHGAVVAHDTVYIYSETRSPKILCIPLQVLWDLHDDPKNNVF